MLERIRNFLINNLVPYITKFNNHQYVESIVYSLSIITPISIVGGLSLLIESSINFDTIQPTNLLYEVVLKLHLFIIKYSSTILVPYKLTLGIISIIVASSVAYNLSTYYNNLGENLDNFMDSIIAGIVFISVNNGMNKESISTNYFDGKGVFTAFIIGILTVELSRFLIRKNISIKLSKNIPPAVSNSFTKLLYIIVNISIFLGINFVVVNSFGLLLPEIVLNMFMPIMKLIDSFWFVFFIALFSSILWTGSIHGSQVFGSITTIVLTSNLLVNTSAYFAGQPLPFIIAGQVTVFLIFIGGSGATLGLNLLMLKSRSIELKNIGQKGISSGLFGINEPLLFGIPIISNELLSTPFIVTPIINSLIAYYSIKWNIINKAIIAVPWTMPPFIGMPLATFDYRALLLVLFIVFVDMIIYYPFFKKLEKQMINNLD